MVSNKCNEAIEFSRSRRNFSLLSRSLTDRATHPQRERADISLRSLCDGFARTKLRVTLEFPRNASGNALTTAAHAPSTERNGAARRTTMKSSSEAWLQCCPAVALKVRQTDRPTDRWSLSSKGKELCLTPTWKLVSHSE